MNPTCELTGDKNATPRPTRDFRVELSKGVFAFVSVGVRIEGKSSGHVATLSDAAYLNLVKGAANSLGQS